MFSQSARRSGGWGWGVNGGSRGGGEQWKQSWIPNSLTIEKIISTALLSVPGSVIKGLGYKKRHLQLCWHFLTGFTPTFPQTLLLVWREEIGLSRADLSQNDVKVSTFNTRLKPETTHCRLYKSNLTLISSQWNTFGAHRNSRIHCLWSQACTCTCRILVCSGSLRGGCTCGCLSHTRHGLEEDNCTCGNRQTPPQWPCASYLDSHICRQHTSGRNPPDTCRSSCQRCSHTVCCTDRGSFQLHIHQYLRVDNNERHLHWV